MRAAGFPSGKQTTADDRVPFHWITAFFEIAARETNDDLLGFHFGQTADVRDSGLVGFLGAYAETLRDAIHNSAFYARVFGDGVAFDTTRLDAEGRLGWDYNLPASVDTRQYAEWYAATCVSVCRTAAGSHIRPRRVCLRHPHRNASDEMARFFGCEVEFGADENAVYFEPGALDRRIPASDRKLLAYLRGVAQDILDRHGGNVPDLPAQIERLIMARLSSGRVGQDEIAAELGMSQRTLSRRLQEMDLTFRGLLDGLREALATRYLSESDLTQAQIAFMLGFADQSSFITAYRRWTGKTPGDARRH